MLIDDMFDIWEFGWRRAKVREGSDIIMED